MVTEHTDQPDNAKPVGTLNTVVYIHVWHFNESKYCFDLYSFSRIRTKQSVYIYSLLKDESVHEIVSQTVFYSGRNHWNCVRFFKKNTWFENSTPKKVFLNETEPFYLVHNKIQSILRLYAKSHFLISLFGARV